jgi:hypothetical protein
MPSFNTRISSIIGSTRDSGKCRRDLESHSTLFIIKIVEAHGQLIHIHARGANDGEEMPLKSRRVWDLAST